VRLEDAVGKRGRRRARLALLVDLGGRVVRRAVQQVKAAVVEEHHAGRAAARQRGRRGRLRRLESAIGVRRRRAAGVALLADACVRIILGAAQQAEAVAVVQRRGRAAAGRPSRPGRVEGGDGVRCRRRAGRALLIAQQVVAVALVRGLRAAAIMLSAAVQRRSPSAVPHAGCNQLCPTQQAGYYKVLGSVRAAAFSRAASHVLLQRRQGRRGGLSGATGPRTAAPCSAPMRKSPSDCSEWVCACLPRGASARAGLACSGGGPADARSCAVRMCRDTSSSAPAARCNPLSHHH